MQFDALLDTMVREQASDLFLTVGAPAHLKVQGRIHPLPMPPFAPGEVAQLVWDVLGQERRDEFERELELNVAHDLPGVGRFRLNVYRQRGEVALVVRYIRARIPSLESLGLPPLLQELVMEPRGLVLVVGATGSGKSTTLAAMIDHRNTHGGGHLLTIEEPIEYLHEHKRCVVGQREVGVDTHSYANALKNAMREAPDVILIGEIRDHDTMRHALTYAETGHLCLSTLHANNANQAIDRIINFFPDSAHRQLYTDLSLNLRAVISQRLLPGSDGNLVPAVEILLRSAYVADLIAKREIGQLKDAMARGNETGMRTFDQALFELQQQGRIHVDVALANADARGDLALRIRLSQGLDPAKGDTGLSLQR
ncbi:MAG TPA: PilT/PilU family type 4a pilus ATPase [Hyphomicrobiales bacterium]|nr:PilT/PilU family type 4a pilus ATPase [Hyphomicrobiales bacterium]